MVRSCCSPVLLYVKRVCNEVNGKLSCVHCAYTFVHCRCHQPFQVDWFCVYQNRVASSNVVICYTDSLLAHFHNWKTFSWFVFRLKIRAPPTNIDYFIILCGNCIVANRKLHSCLQFYLASVAVPIEQHHVHFKVDWKCVDAFNSCSRAYSISFCTTPAAHSLCFLYIYV